eukprot:6551962-Pyramimonas_sp.AAC.1
MNHRLPAFGLRCEVLWGHAHNQGILLDQVGGRGQVVLVLLEKAACGILDVSDVVEQQLVGVLRAGALVYARDNRLAKIKESRVLDGSESAHPKGLVDKLGVRGRGVE